MRKLNDGDVIEALREEWNARVRSLQEKVDVVMNAKIDGEKESLVSSGLKVKHKNSGFLYTVSSVSPRDVILKTPEGEEFMVDAPTFEAEYMVA